MVEPQVIVCAKTHKKTARHFCSGGLSVSLVARLAVPLRQRAREAEKIAEEPAMHGPLKHEPPDKGK
jgi:hypothetical protein